MVKVCGSARGLEGRRTFPLVGKIRKEEKKGDLKGLVYLENSDKHYSTP